MFIVLYLTAIYVAQSTQRNAKKKSIHCVSLRALRDIFYPIINYHCNVQSFFLIVV